MAAVKIGGIGDGKVPHGLGEIAKGCLNQKMVMVLHQYKAMDHCFINFNRLGQNLQKLLSVNVIPEDGLTRITPIDDMIKGTRILYA